MLKKLTTISLIILVTLSNTAYSTPISLSDFSSNAKTEGFDSVPLLAPIPNYSDFNVIGLGGTPTAINDTVGGQQGDAIPISPPNVIGMDGQGITTGKSVKFLFNSPIYQVGLYLIDVEDYGATLTAFGLNDNLLETIAITPQGRSGLSQFYGIQNTGMQYIIIGTTSGEGIAVDNLTYSSAQVPEPNTLILLSIGMGGIALFRRKK